MKGPRGIFTRMGRIGMAAVYYKGTGEYRPVLKGEFYISGSIPEVYEAPADLGASYWIAAPLAGEVPREIERDGFLYRLVGVAR